MSLQSKLFRGDRALEAAAVSDSAHVTPGSLGRHVSKIQAALSFIDGAVISGLEIQRASYGPSTARMVLLYKQKRNIINRSYQTAADDIVGKMTIASLDREMLKQEGASAQAGSDQTRRSLAHSSSEVSGADCSCERPSTPAV